MKKREIHAGKSHGERDYYARYLKNKDSEPTSAEETVLEPSTEDGTDLREPKLTGRRPIGTGKKIWEHIQEHWLEWAFCIVIALVIFFGRDVLIDLTRIETNQLIQKESISFLQSRAQKISDKNQEQDLTLKEHSIRISHVEEKVNKIEK